MGDVLLSVGDIIKDKRNETCYRIIAIVCGAITLCEMNTTKFVLSQIEHITLIDLLFSNEVEKDTEEEIIFDVNALSSSVRDKYEKKLLIINEVVTIASPTYIYLAGKSPKAEIKELMKKYNLARNSFWRMCTLYFQSGMKNYSLVDSKAFGVNKGKQYIFSSKPGVRSEYLGDTGVILTPEIITYFEDALNNYKSSRQKTISSAFDRMNNLHFTRVEIINGAQSLVLLPQSQRPTKRQFSYYVEKHLSHQEKDVIKTSAIEQRNNKRLITSDSLNGVYGPGDMVEIDACEADVSLVSSIDRNRTIGRPIVYFMIDVYTRLMLAVSVSFDNNSVLGITNLFLNLADNKKEYCDHFGMGFENDDVWPSCVIPRRLRVDRGSEFKSKEFDRICNELGIEKQIVPGASGSLKGVVEQSFHQMHSKQNVHLEDIGLIEKRYDSEHHKEASLTIEQYTKMVINFVLTHNQQYDKDYHMTREMLEKGVKPIPALLWKYGIEKYGSPRPIPSIDQYLFNLMTPVIAKISRRGICYKDLWYLSLDDKVLSSEMFNARNKKVSYEVRMDMRDVGAVYYIRDRILVKAPLNKNIAGNLDYDGMTMKQYEDYRKEHKEINAKGRVHNEELSAFNYAVNDTITSDAKKATYSDAKDMRPARETEKQMISSEGKIATRLEHKSTNVIEKTTVIEEIPEQEPKIKGNIPISKEEPKTEIDYTNWEEAFKLFD